MNPDMQMVAAYNAGRDFDRREREAKQAQSRAAQPRRKDNKRSRRTGKR
jgi:hypothetical protein